MGEKSDRIYIEHILEMIDEVAMHLKKGGRKSFYNNLTVRQATLRSLQLMSESTQRLSSSTKKSIKGIPWQDISDFRNVLVHDYMGSIDLNVVWDIIEESLPDLKKIISDYHRKNYDRKI